jgi:S1-C subfamily serine protease
MRSSPSSSLSSGWPRALAWVLVTMALAASGRAGAEEEVTHVRVGRGRAPVVGAVLADDADGSTIHVGRVQPDSPAARAGLRSGDRIVSVNGCRVRGTAGWDAALAKALPGATLALGVWRAPGGVNPGALIYLQLPTDGVAVAGPTGAARPPVPDAPCEP